MSNDLSKSESEIIDLPIKVPAKRYLLLIWMIFLVLTATAFFNVESMSGKIYAFLVLVLLLVIGWLLYSAFKRRAILINESRIGWINGISKNYSWVESKDIVYIFSNSFKSSGKKWSSLIIISTEGGMRGFNAIGWKLGGLSPRDRDIIKKLEQRYGKIYPFLIYRNTLSEESNKILDEYLLQARFTNV